MSWNVENSHGHFLKNLKILLIGDYSCCVCSQGQLITKQFPSNIVVESPSFSSNVVVESPSFLERIQSDIVNLYNYLQGHSGIIWF